MSHRTNMRPGPCAQCKASVAERAGTLLGPPWRVVCQACLPFPLPSAATIEVTLHVKGDFEVKPKSRLGGERWVNYKSTIDRVGVRTRKLRDVWTTTGKLEIAPALIKALSDEGFVLDVAADVLAAIEVQAAKARALVDAAAVRTAAVDAELAKRGKALYPFQHEGVAWLAPRQNALLADACGLGKSIQVLAALPASAPVLVIGPAVAKGVWKRETSAWRPDLRVAVLSGRGSFRWPQAGEVVVTNYAILPQVEVPTSEKDDDGEPQTVLAPFLASAPAGLVVVVDECHAIKGSQTAQTKRVRAITKAARAAGGRTWLLSATPMLNRPSELWSVLQGAALATEAFGSWFKFAQMMGGRQETIRKRGGGYVSVWTWDGTPTAASADALRRVMLRRIKEDVLPQFPSLTYQEIDVELDDELRGECDELWDDIRDDFEDIFEGKRSSIPFEEISAMRARLASAKIEAMDAVVDEYEEAGEPIVVFSSHREPIEHLAKRPGWAVIMGGVDNAKRSEIEEAFQRGELKGVAATIKAAGVAITLTRASTCVFVDQDWTPALNEQARDRIRRIGTTKPVLVKLLIADHDLDRRVAELLERKREVIGASVERAKLGADEHALNAAQVAEGAQTAMTGMDTRRAEQEVANAVHAAALEALLAKFAAEDESAERERASDDAAKKDPRLALERRIERAWTKFKGQDSGAPRAAASHQELWASRALQQLALMDMDYAYEQNGVGFNKSDCGIGHALARAAAAEMLTDGGWRLAIQVAMHYPGQVGRPMVNEASL